MLRPASKMTTWMSAGISHEELERMLAGPNRENVKNWIESLPTETRVIFVLRAVAGFTADETAAMLAGHGGTGAAGWNAGRGAGDLPAGSVLACFAADSRDGAITGVNRTVAVNSEHG